MHTRYLTRMQRLLIEQTRRGGTGGREKGRKGGGRGEKGEREKGERGREKGEKEEGEGRTGGREKGGGRREKGTPLYPSQQAYHKEWPYG